MNLDINTILHTKNGYVIGNAIIIEIKNSSLLKEKIYKILTDYGNESKLTEKEIKEYFHEITIKATKDHKNYIKKDINDFKSSIKKRRSN